MSQPTKTERTRKLIIEASAAIFNTKGYYGTSLADLTEATGLTKGSIYGNFTNKEEVAARVFDYNYARVQQLIREQMDAATTCLDKLMVFARVYDQYISPDFPQGGCPVLNTAVEADDTNSLLKERAANAIGTWNRQITSLLQTGIAQGEFKEGVDVAQLALSIIALMEGGIMIAKVTNSPASLDKIMQTVALLLAEIKR